MTTINKTKVNKLYIKTLFDARVARAKSSFCWRYFGDLNVKADGKKKHVLTEQVFCNACLSDAQEENADVTFGLAKIKSYAKTVSTGNLNRHLRDVHSIKEEETAAELIRDFFSTQLKSKSSPGSKTKVTDSVTLARDIALWYCKSLIPLDSISDEGMTQFFQKYKIVTTKEDMPSRDIVTRIAFDDLYHRMLEVVKVQITTDSVGHATVTFDLWTDQYRRLDYVTFALHYLTADFKHKSYTLCTKLMKGKKTGEKIKEMFDEAMQCFDLQEMDLHAVIDAGSEAKRAVALSGLDSQLCLGHGLHSLVIMDGIHSVPELDAFIKKCKQIVKTLELNLPELEEDADEELIKFIHLLEQVLENLENEEKEPIAHNDEESGAKTKAINEVFIHFGSTPYVPSMTKRTPTRWHSVLTLLECLAHFGNRNPVNKILSQSDQKELKIYQQEWNLLEDLVKFLRKFRDVIDMLSTQKTACLNLAMVFYLEIKDILNSLLDEESSIMLSLKHKMLAKIDSRFPITDKIVAAAMLDPRFISLSQIDSYLERKNTTRAAFLAEYIKAQPHVASAFSSKDSLLLRLSKKHSSGASSLAYEFDAADQECRKYLTTATAENFSGDDVLLYWQENKSSFPMLSELARALLSIPATSTPSERMFSEAGLILNAKRCRLSPARVNKMLFIHDNYKMCK